MPMPRTDKKWELQLPMPKSPMLFKGFVSIVQVITIHPVVFGFLYNGNTIWFELIKAFFQLVKKKK